MSDVLDRVGARLAEHGLWMRYLGDPTAEPATDAPALGTPIELVTESASTRYLAVVARRPILAAVRAGGLATHPPVLVVGDHLPPRTVALLRRAGYQYADAAGNARLGFDHVQVDVEGRTPPRRPVWFSARRRAKATAELFSTRWSQVVLVLLTWPALWEAPVRDVARAAGVNPRQAREVLEFLRETGYRSGPDDRVAADTLLSYWTSVYATGLHEQLGLGRYIGDTTRTPVPPAGGRLWVSGEHAVRAEIEAPSTITVYVEELDPALADANQWRVDEEEPTIQVRRKFWTSPDDEDDDLAPWPLVYADLHAINDAELDEVAAQWRSRFV